MRSRLMSLLCSTAAAFVLAGTAGAAEELAAQTVAAAGVSMKAKPRVLANGDWEFEIALDTHSQELADDLVKSATLVAAGKTFVAVSWQGDAPGGHHRKGVLKFRAIEPRPQEFELRVLRPGESTPRSFRWRHK